MAVCINCSILLRSSLQLHEYWAMEHSPELVLIAEEWCGREIVTASVMNVSSLWQERLRTVLSLAIVHLINRQLGHRCVCISCGISLGRRTGRRRHRLHERSEERNYIAIQIFPRQVPDEAFVCHACWMRAYENIMRQPIEPDVALPSSEPMEPSLRETIPDLPSPPQVEIDAATAPPSSSVWFLGWARFQDVILPPASFLDGILVREDIENE